VLISKWGFVLWNKKSCVFILFSIMYFLNSYSFPDQVNTNNSISAEKININKVSLSQIEKVFSDIGMDNSLALKLFQYRQNHGEIYSFEELILIGFTLEEIELIKKYFYIETERIGVDEILESLGGDQFENIEYYYDFLVTPMNLNEASVGNLAELPGMDFEKAKRIVKYRSENEIVSLFQLTNAGISKKDLLLMSPFITIKPPSEKGFIFLSRISSEYVYNKTISNFTTDETNFPQLYYSRFLLKGRTIEAYLSIPVISNSITTMEWEEILPYSRYYFLWSSKGINKKGLFNILLGQYQISLGQNLLFGQAFPSFISDIRKFPVKREGRKIIPYKSTSYDVDQNGIRDYFNGFVGQIDLTEREMGMGMPELQIIGFYSYFNNEPLSGITNQEDFGGGLEGRFLNESILVGMAFSRQRRFDNAYNNTGMNFYYDIFPLEKFNLFGEYANFGGFSTKHGLILRPEPFYVSTIVYYAQTNFMAPNGGDILNGKRDVAGFLAGVGWDGEFSDGQFYADFYKKTTNENFYQRYEGKIKFLFSLEYGIIKIYEIELKSRYSILQEGESLRSYVNQKIELFQKKILLSVRWQNLLNYTFQETGNMGTFRITFKPINTLYFSFEWSTYNSASYNSALYRLKTKTLDESPEIKPYYGTGNEFSLSANWELAEWGKVGLRLSRDERCLPGESVVINRSVSGFIDLKL